MSYYHFNNIHCGYQRLIDLITFNNFIQSNIYKDCKEYIKTCYICSQTKINTFRIPKIDGLQAKYPNEIIQMDLTDLPDIIKTENKFVNKKFKLAVVIDYLSKFTYAEIIDSKSAKVVLPVLMRFINIKGKPKILLTDNGTEFVNGLFTDYLKFNNSEKRNTRPYNPR